MDGLITERNAYFSVAPRGDGQILIDWLERVHGKVERRERIIEAGFDRAGVAAIERATQEIFDETRETHYPAHQCPAEFVRFLDIVKARFVRSYLEIGARFGGSFEAVMHTLPSGSRGLAIDFPGADGTSEFSAVYLCRRIQKLRQECYKVAALFGPSGAREIIKAAEARGPYDCLFIDGDHSYEGVKRDFETYSPMAKMVVFHDIGSPDLDVMRFWHEIKDGYEHVEIIEPDSGIGVMGIGVLFNA